MENIVLIYLYAFQSSIQFLGTILAEAKVFKSMKQQLKFFRGFLGYVHCFDGASLQLSGFSAAYAS